MGKSKTGALRSRIVGEGAEKPDQLLANPSNWRRHPKEQQDALEGLLREVGWVQRVIVNRATGHIVDGHLRVELALRRNEPSVPVVYVDLTEAEEKIVLAAIDPIGGLATTDQAMLDQLLDSVDAQDADLAAFLAGLHTPNEQEPPGAGDDDTGNYSEQYGVIVVCKDAAEQEAVYNRLVEDGYECKVVCT